MAICREAVISNDYKGFGLPNRGSDEELQALLGASCIRRVSENLVFAYFYYPVEQEGGREFPFGIMPKCYGLLSEEELAASGVLQVRESPYTNLYGSGVLLGFVDTGINFAEEVFRNADGSTKLVALWDQTLELPVTQESGIGDESGVPPVENRGEEREEALYDREITAEENGRDSRMENGSTEAFYGQVFSSEQLNAALQSEMPYSVISSRDENGHGSAVARAAGAVAPLTAIAMVKLKQAKPYLREFFQIPEASFCAAEDDIIYGVEWLLALARQEERPLVLCLALGSNQGNHTGQTVLSRYLDEVAQIPGVCVCTAAGNEGGSGHHFFGRVTGDYEEVELNVGEGVEGFTTELWAVEPDVFTIEIISPAGEVIPRIQGRPTFNRQYSLFFEGGTIRIQSNLFDQNVGTQGIWIRFAGIAAGVWRIRVYAEGEFSRSFHMWLPVSPFLTGEAFFLRPDPYVLICDPGAAREVLTFTAYDVISGALYPQASYGYTADDRIKPEIAAPQGEVLYAGTGLAASFGAGSAALVFEAAIRNTRYMILDTLVIKRLFIAAAERDGREYPNREWGYGKLDVYGVFVRTPGRG